MFSEIPCPDCGEAVATARALAALVRDGVVDSFLSDQGDVDVACETCGGQRTVDGREVATALLADDAALSVYGRLGDEADWLGRNGWDPMLVDAIDDQLAAERERRRVGEALNELQTAADRSWEPDFERVVERERESRRRREQIQRLAADLASDLDGE